MNAEKDKYIIKKKEAWKIFDAIYKKYDLLNHILSFGQDFFWRRKIVKSQKGKQGLKILDIATGTGDVILSFLNNSYNVNFICGIDMSSNMVGFGKRKLGKRVFKTPWGLIRSDAVSLPVKSNSFDLVTIAFGIRNMPVPEKVLREMRRVLKPRGELIVLEFSQPKNCLIKRINLLYLRLFIPLIGRLISGNFGAYKYLNKTIESFPYGEDFLIMMRNNGYKSCNAIPLTFGAVMIYRGNKEQ